MWPGTPDGSIWRHWRSAWLVAWLLLLAVVAQAQVTASPLPAPLPQPYAAAVATDLRAQPMLDAALLQRVAPGQQMQMLQMRGGWAQVRVEHAQGWVRLSHIRSVQVQVQGRTLPAQDANTRLASLFTADSTTPVATTGARGLFKGWVTSSRPDAQAVRQMDGYTVSAAQAREFARAGQLQARSVADDAGDAP